MLYVYAIFIAKYTIHIMNSINLKLPYGFANWKRFKKEFNSTSWEKTSEDYKGCRYVFYGSVANSYFYKGTIVFDEKVMILYPWCAIRYGIFVAKLKLEDVKLFNKRTVKW